MNILDIDRCQCGSEDSLRMRLYEESTSTFTSSIQKLHVQLHDRDCNEWTLLHHAAHQNQWETVASLLAAGLSSDALDIWGRTPEFYVDALHPDAFKMFRLLFANSPFFTTDMFSRSPLDFQLSNQPMNCRMQAFRALVSMWDSLNRPLVNPGVNVTFLVTMFEVDARYYSDVARDCIAFLQSCSDADVFSLLFQQRFLEQICWMEDDFPGCAIHGAEVVRTLLTTRDLSFSSEGVLSTLIGHNVPWQTIQELVDGGLQPSGVDCFLNIPSTRAPRTIWVSVLNQFVSQCLSPENIHEVRRMLQSATPSMRVLMYEYRSLESPRSILLRVFMKLHRYPQFVPTAYALAEFCPYVLDPQLTAFLLHRATLHSITLAHSIANLWGVSMHVSYLHLMADARIPTKHMFSALYDTQLTVAKRLALLRAAAHSGRWEYVLGFIQIHGVAPWILRSIAGKVLRGKYFSQETYHRILKLLLLHREISFPALQDMPLPERWDPALIELCCMLDIFRGWMAHHPLRQARDRLHARVLRTHFIDPIARLIFQFI